MHNSTPTHSLFPESEIQTKKPLLGGHFFLMPTLMRLHFGEIACYRIDYCRRLYPPAIHIYHLNPHPVKILPIFKHRASAKGQFGKMNSVSDKLILNIIHAVELLDNLGSRKCSDNLPPVVVLNHNLFPKCRLGDTHNFRNMMFSGSLRIPFPLERKQISAFDIVKRILSHISLPVGADIILLSFSSRNQSFLSLFRIPNLNSGHTCLSNAHR